MLTPQETTEACTETRGFGGFLINLPRRVLSSPELLKAKQAAMECQRPGTSLPRHRHIAAVTASKEWFEGSSYEEGAALP